MKLWYTVQNVALQSQILIKSMMTQLKIKNQTQVFAETNIKYKKIIADQIPKSSLICRNIIDNVQPKTKAYKIIIQSNRIHQERKSNMLKKKNQYRAARFKSAKNSKEVQKIEIQTRIKQSAERFSRALRKINKIIIQKNEFECSNKKSHDKRISQFLPVNANSLISSKKNSNIEDIAITKEYQLISTSLGQKLQQQKEDMSNNAEIIQKRSNQTQLQTLREKIIDLKAKALIMYIFSINRYKYQSILIIYQNSKKLINLQ